MRKFLTITLSLVLVFALALPVSAGVKNTVHDFQAGPGNAGAAGVYGAERGMCSYCHIPHSSKGDRLWPTSGEGDAKVAGQIGVLCASCHDNSVADQDNDNSPGSAAGGVSRGTDVYNTGLVNHVLIDDSVYANDTAQASWSGQTQFNQQNIWPYCGTEGTTGTSQRIECSSCHNPHDDSKGQSTVTSETNHYLGYGNDYLRSSMFNTSTGVAFCEYCHEEKTRGGYALNSIGTGTHPVGTTANAGDTSQADIHIESSERATLSGTVVAAGIFYDMGIGTGVLGSSITDGGIGMHLTSYNTGGVTCQTCHRVHGAAAGAAPNGTWQAPNSDGSYYGAWAVGTGVYLAASDDGYANILAVENDANGGTAGYTYSTEGRTAGDYNDLCIDCHETTPSVGTNWMTYDNNALRTNADPAPIDPHPVNIAPDGMSEVGFDLTVVDPSATWVAAGGTNARWAGEAATSQDFALTSTGRWWGLTGTASATSEVVCLTCHAIHDGEKGTPILRVQSTTYCADCHTNALGNVSHPVGNGSAMRDNPDAATWPNGDSLPLENYYSGSGGTSSFNTAVDNTTDMACFTCHAAHDGVDGYMLRVTMTNSRICTGCHTDISAGGWDATNVTSIPERENPSNYIAEYNEAVTARLGSHYTGTIVNTTASVGELRWAFSGVWTDTSVAGVAFAQTSHFGTGQNRIMCQSCHTPHNAASGLVEENIADGTRVNAMYTEWTHQNDQGYPADNAANWTGPGSTNTPMCNTPTTALLLGNNVQSKICATCHWPTGTHVTTIYTVAAKPDPARAAGKLQDYRDYCTRINSIIIGILNAEQEEAYNVFDLIGNPGTEAETGGADIRTPESPTNFPPIEPDATPLITNNVGKMLCDSCHAPHGAVTGAGAFILEAGDGNGDNRVNSASNQRVVNRDYSLLCWKCHDK